jgi:hypothetical protein
MNDGATSRVDLFVYFMCVGGFALIIVEFIKIRLKTHYLDLFGELGRPRFQDSNLGATYWRFRKFIWWGHFSIQNDILIHSLCILACLSEVVGVVLFFLVI